MQGLPNHYSQITHLLLYPSFWLLLSGLSSHYFPYNLPLLSTVEGNIFEKWLQGFVSFGNPCFCNAKTIGKVQPALPQSNNSRKISSCNTVSHKPFMMMTLCVIDATNNRATCWKHLRCLISQLHKEVEAQIPQS